MSPSPAETTITIRRVRDRCSVGAADSGIPMPSTWPVNEPVFSQGASWLALVGAPYAPPYTVPCGPFAGP